MTVAEFINKVGFQVDQSSVNAVNSTMSNIKSTATKILGAIGIGISLAQLNAIADEFNAINDRINYAVGYAEDMKDTQKEILAAANECKVSYSDMASAVVDLKTANSEVFPIEEATEFVEYVNKLGKAAGYSDSEISTMQSSIQRVVASGTMGASDISRMLRTTPALIQNICEGLGVTQDELSAMADAGQITAETIKQALFNAESSIDNSFSNLNYSISDALLNIRNQWGFWVDDLNSTLLISQTIAKLMVKAFNGIMVGLNWVKTGLTTLADKLGGTENLLKLVAIVAAAFIAVFSWSKIVAGAQAFIKAIKGISSALGMGMGKMLLIVAVIILIALLVEDFINFLQGNDSIIGTFFDKIGIGADNARQAIFDAWNKVVAFLTAVWETIKEMASMFVDTVKGFFDRHGEQIQNTFGRVWNVIKELLSGVWTFISQLAATLFGDTEDSIEGSTESTHDTVINTWQQILDALSAVWDAIFTVVDTVLNDVLTVVEAVFGLIKQFWDAWGPDVLALFKTVWDAIGRIFNDALQIITGVANFISSVFKGDWEGAWNAIKDIFSAVWDAILAELEVAWNAVQLLLKMGLSALKSIWETVWGAISTFFTNIWNAIVAFFTGVWNAIVAFFTGVWNGIVSFVTGVLNGIASFFQNIWNTIYQTISTVLTNIWNTISSIWNSITSFVSNAMAAIFGVISNVWNSVQSTTQNVWNTISSTVQNLISGIGNTISNVINNARSVISNGASAMQSGMINAFNSISSGISSAMSNVTSAITNGISAAGTAVKNMASAAWSWGADIVNGIANGIRNAISSVTSAVSSVASIISSYLHFSVPDTGPLTDFQSWMPDFVGGLAKGIEGSRDMVKDAVGDLASDMTIMANANVVSPSTAGTAQSATYNSRNVSQNVNINNTFNGERAAQQNAASIMNQSADDVTAQLARGLAYAR